MSRMSCALTANFATAAVLSDTALNWPWIAHVNGCLRCQAHMASVRATRRRLGEMRKETASPPVGFDPSVALKLDPKSAVSKSIVTKSTVTRPVATTSSSGAGRQMAAVSAAIAAAALAAAWIWRRTQAKSGEPNLVEPSPVEPSPIELWA